MNRFVFFITITAVMLIFVTPDYLCAQQKYMLCIGINNYTNTAADSMLTPQGRLIHNLHGCVNDVNNISQTFTDYYGFPEINIKKLTDRNAKRDSIIAQLKQFARVCKPGDYMVFFYSGHGSFANNETTQRTLQKKYANTIVPADADRGEVQDINNLELNDLLLPFVANNVHLTVIMDACYSGTNTRGSTLYELSNNKEVEPVPEEFAKPIIQQKITTLLYKKGAVTLAACQDNQESKETTINGQHCGAFTYCLCRSIRMFSTASVQDLYNLTMAQLKFNSQPQIPVLETDDSRRNMNLPGTAEAKEMKTAFSLIERNANYQIQGGFLDGLSTGDLLVNNVTKDTVKIDSVIGPERSAIVPVNASGQLKNTSIGNMYSVLRLARFPDAPIKVFLGNSLSQKKIDKVLQQAADLQKNTAIHWITPFDNIIPEAIIYYNAGTGNWQMNKNGKPATIVLLNVDKDTAFTSLAKGTLVFLELPLPEALATKLTATIEDNNNKNIALQTAADNANYILAGTLLNGKPQYGWMNIQWKTAQQSDIPFRTDFFTVDNISKPEQLPTDSLYDRLSKLGKIAGWLTLQSPVTETTIPFPFTLVIRDTKKKIVANNNQVGHVNTDDTLTINFENEEHTSVVWDSTRLFIYVFSIDPKGNMLLLFPGERTSIFDYPPTDFTPWLATIRNTTAGVYHFFLLSCKERILNTDVFNQQGVITRDAAYYDNPLEALINDGGTNGRDNMRTPANWLIKKVDIITSDKAVTKPKKR